MRVGRDAPRSGRRSCGPCRTWSCSRTGAPSPCGARRGRRRRGGERGLGRVRARRWWGAGTYSNAGACQTTFMDVEKPDASMPVSAESAKRHENVALRAAGAAGQRVSDGRRAAWAGVRAGRGAHRSRMRTAQGPAKVPWMLSMSDGRFADSVHARSGSCACERALARARAHAAHGARHPRPVGARTPPTGTRAGGRQADGTGRGRLGRLRLLPHTISLTL